jgi:biopolymer transport protein ExbB/TolQ
MRSNIARLTCQTLGLLIMLGSIGDRLLASTASIAPEIDGSIVATGIGLLAAGVLILRARRRAK